VIKIEKIQSLEWDYLDWSEKYKYQIENDLPTNDLRIAVFKNTLHLLDIGGFYSKKNFYFSTIVTKYYNETENELDTLNKYDTKFVVIKSDILDTTELLKKSGLNPVIINAANPRKPGGEITKGEQGNEEEMFIRTSISQSLYQFSNLRKIYGLEKHNSNYSYPLLNDNHGIYSNNIVLFRGNVDTGYKLLESPIPLAFISVPSVKRPRLDLVDGKYVISDPFLKKIKTRITTSLRIAVNEKHDCLVLNGFGSSVAKIPPQHMAEILKDLLCFGEFCCKFKSVVFTITDNPKIREEYNPSGDFMPFFDAFM